MDTVQMDLLRIHKYGGTLKYLQWCQLSSQLAQQASCMSNSSQYAIELLDRADPWKVQEPLVKV